MALLATQDEIDEVERIFAELMLDPEFVKTLDKANAEMQDEEKFRQKLEAAIKYQKEMFTFSLEDDLKPVPSISEDLLDSENLAALEKLLVVVAMHVRDMATEPFDDDFYAKLFEMAIAKLPSSLLEAYKGKPALKKNLPDLQSFLDELLIGQWTKVQAARASGQHLHCSYCKKRGNHRIANCVKVSLKASLFTYFLLHNFTFNRSRNAFA